jgi:hypothetical protein
MTRLALHLGSGGALHQIGWNWSTLGYPAKYESAIKPATCSAPASTEFLREGPAPAETASGHGRKYVDIPLHLSILCVQLDCAPVGLV